MPDAYVAKRILLNTLAAIPALRAALDRWRQPENYADPHYNVGVLAQHLAALRRTCSWSPEGATILELGPGGNLGNAYLLWLCGASRVYGVDNYRHLDFQRATTSFWEQLDRVVESPEVHAKLPFVASRLQQRATAETTPARLLDSGAIVYLAPVDAASLPLDDVSVDLVFSQAVLEHVARPALVLGEIARVLAPGGLTSHQVDLRDHFRAGTIDMLRYGPTLWKLMASHSHGFVNRWRASEFGSAARDLGLDVLVADSTGQLQSPPDPAKLSREFRHLSADDLATIGLFLVARKPAVAEPGVRRGLN